MAEKGENGFIGGFRVFGGAVIDLSGDTCRTINGVRHAKGNPEVIGFITTARNGGR